MNSIVKSVLTGTLPNSARIPSSKITYTNHLLRFEHTKMRMQISLAVNLRGPKGTPLLRIPLWGILPSPPPTQWRNTEIFPTPGTSPCSIDVYWPNKSRRTCTFSILEGMWIKQLKQDHLNRTHVKFLIQFGKIKGESVDSLLSWQTLAQVFVSMTTINNGHCTIK